MVKKWSVSYPAVNGVEQRRVYVYLPTMYEADPERRYSIRPASVNIFPTSSFSNTWTPG